MYGRLLHTFLGYNLEIDIWSLGIICYILLCGFPPFRSESGDRDELFHAILFGTLDFPHPYWTSVDQNALHLITSMLDRDPTSRLKASDVLQSAWIKRKKTRIMSFV